MTTKTPTSVSDTGTHLSPAASSSYSHSPVSVHAASYDGTEVHNSTEYSHAQTFSLNGIQIHSGSQPCSGLPQKSKRLFLGPHLTLPENLSVPNFF